jgi:hypothetical protein
MTIFDRFFFTLSAKKHFEHHKLYVVKQYTKRKCIYCSILASFQASAAPRPENSLFGLDTQITILALRLKN